jgi:FkbM family methyltransferase
MTDVNQRLQRPDIRLRDGVWWPAFDHKPDNGLAEVVKGLPAIDLVVELCDRKRTAFQAGGNVGLWARRLARSFKNVLTFEPNPASYRCLGRNLQGTSNVQTFRSALGAEIGVTLMRPSPSAGTWRVDDKSGTFEVPQTTIDSARCTDVDAILLDVEGHEVEVLKGAAETITRCHPIILVEELERSRDGIRAHLHSLGYRSVREFRHDRIYEYDGGYR